MARELWIDDVETLKSRIDAGSPLSGSILQGLDLRGVEVDWDRAAVDGAVLLGCRFDDRAIEEELRRRGASLFPRFEGLPYDPYRSELYRWQELMEGWSAERDDSLDLRIYRHFVARGRHFPPIEEALAQRIHDHAIDHALHEFLGFDGEETGWSLPRRRAVGIMGGHGKRRDDPDYARAAEVAWHLARRDYLVVTGGGPGVMEAGNLGAWLAREELVGLRRETERLAAAATSYRDAAWVESARALVEHYPDGEESLAVPTWFYGHEPSNLFASAIAKYFSNSVREDGLLAICLYGVVFAPGSAGTTQEVFIDAVQNHYATFQYRSPMVFLGRHRYQEETLIWPLIEQLAEEGGFRDWVWLTDDPEEAAEFVASHPPRIPSRSD